MKKITTLLCLLLTMFTFSASAQQLCDARFTYQVSGNNVQFGTASFTTPAFQQQWTFGDGTAATSNLANPEHHYAGPGTYYVNHIVSYRSPNDSNTVECTDSVGIAITIADNNACNLNAYITYYRDSVQTNTYYFANQSSGMTPATNVYWSFGDGATSNGGNPTHTYTTSGTYRVCLYLERDSICTSDTCISIQVSVPNACNLQAAFSAVQDSTNPFRFQFSNTSTPFDATDSVRYTFGDGTSSTNANPSHTYANAGTYNVCIRVKKVTVPGTPACVREFCRTIVIQQTPPACNLHASFIFRRDSVQTNKVYFTNLSFGFNAPINSVWNFGDGTTSFTANPTHTYAVSGAYMACLRVQSDSNCVSDTCILVQVTVPNACNLVAGFSAVQDSTNPYHFEFSNTSTPFDATDSVRYTFGDGTSSTNANPSHTYTNAGTYNVCIRVKKVTVPGTATCVREFCRTIVIQQTQPACNLRASFTYRRDSVQTNKFYFTNLSAGINNTTVNRWTFGDGTTSDAINPTHTFAATGAYTVCLRLQRDSLCFDDTCLIIQVSVPNACNLVAGFSAVQDSTNPYHFEFANTSTPFDATDSVRYTFGDGSSSVNPNPSHTYANAGTYNVCIRVKKVTVPGTVACVREYCQTIVIRQAPPACNLHAAIVYQRDSIRTNVITFSNQSTGVSANTSVQWSFGDGTSSTEQNPTHVFPATGGYYVCLRVQNDSACSSDTCIVVPVEVPVNPCNFVAAFVFTRDSINPAVIHFTNTSSPFSSADSISWYFGDGGYSTEINPTHTFSDTGLYNVCIYVKNVDTTTGSICVKRFCADVNIAAGNGCQLRASFSSRIDSANRRKVFFTNTSAANAATNAYWTFGDGTSANSWNADHVYTTNGRYAVCLTIINGNCTNTTCDSVLITGPSVPPVNCDSSRMEFTYRRDGYMPNKYFFFAISNRPLVQQSWTFTNTATGAVVRDSQPNPMHVFADTGYYKVCLTGTFRNGCVREYCDWIRINSTTVPQQCVLQAFPNPAHNHVAVNLQLQTPQLITASVYNTQSILVLRRTQQGFTGNNLVDLNINQLRPGFYTIRLVYGNKVCYARFHKF